MNHGPHIQIRHEQRGYLSNEKHLESSYYRHSFSAQRRDQRDLEMEMVPLRNKFVVLFTHERFKMLGNVIIFNFIASIGTLLSDTLSIH